MSNVVALPFVGRDKVEQWIRDLATHESEKVYILDHAVLRMEERDVTQRQVFTTLRLGDLCDAPEWDTKEEKGWKCKFSRTVAGEKITVVAKLIMRDSVSCLVVTVWFN
jgi:Domain of unknown function (DUF4258)